MTGIKIADLNADDWTQINNVLPEANLRVIQGGQYIPIKVVYRPAEPLFIGDPNPNAFANFA